MNRRLAHVIVLTGASLGGLASAATPIDRRLDARAGDTLEVHNVSGSIRVTGGGDNEVHVTGSLADNVQRFDFERSGNRIVVRVVLEEDSRSYEPTTLDIAAPRGIDVEVDAVSAAIVVSAVEGEQRLSSVSGDIRTEAFAEELRARSVSGRVRVDGHDRPAITRVNSVSGSIELLNIGGQVDAQTVSGTVEITASPLDRAMLSSVSGSLSLQGTLSDDARIEATTTSGSIDMRFAGDAAADYELKSFSGRVDNCFGPRPDDSQRRGPGTEHRFQEGNSDAHVYANTLSGSIELCRE
jgi:DUF4097 and DUF4098 domain-containing protein YvlB